MRDIVHRFESEIAKRFPGLDKDGNGKVDAQEVREAIAAARNEILEDLREIEDDVQANPKKSAAIALVVGAGLGFIPGAVVGVTVLAKLFG